MPSAGESGGGTVESSSPSSSDMQSNGVIHENGTSSDFTSSDFAVNGLSKSNGRDVREEEEAVGTTVVGDSEHVSGPVLIRKRKQKQLSKKDSDIVRLIGQHLREMGFK